MIIAGVIDTENKIVRISTALTSLAVIGSAVIWFLLTAIPAAASLMQSGPAPLASRKEVTDLQQQVAQSLGATTQVLQGIVKKQHKDDLRQNAADIETKQHDIAVLQDEIHHHPSDQSLQAELAQDQIDLGDLRTDRQTLLRQ